MSTTQLSSSISNFINGINDKNLDILLTGFTQSSILTDEGKQYISRKAISKWAKEALLGHQASVAIKKSSQNGNTTHVQVMMDGDFAADYSITEPFPLFFEFEADENDEGKIKALVITDWDTASTPSMKAVWSSKTDLQNPLASLHISNRPQPIVPPGWVKVKLQAVGLNFHDIFTLRGLGLHKPQTPVIIGCEGAGTLEDGSEIVLYPLIGDGEFKGDETLDPTRHVPSEKISGTLAEYVIVPRRNIVPRPKELDVVSASVLGIAWLTAYRMLFTRSGLRPGQTMLVQGSSGGVTTALIQLGAAAGMRVWCTGRTKEKRELGLRLGAEKAFAAGEELPVKADAVFDTAGEVTWPHTMDSVKPGGVVVNCGGHAGMTAPLPLFSLFVHQVDVRGSYLGTLDEFKDLISFMAAKSIKPHVGLVLPLEKADEGLRYMLEGKTDGKIVVTF